MNHNETSKLSIVGDRQTGKTHLALLAAIFDGYGGKNVLWQGQTMEYSHHCMIQAVDLCEHLNLELSKVRRTNGKNAIEFLSGGRIDFRPPIRSRSVGHHRYDTHIIDSVPGAGVEPLHVDRVIRTVCS